MKAREFTASRRQPVRLPDGGMEFAIRKIGIVDMLVAGGNPDLMSFLEGKSRVDRIKVIQEKMKDLQKRNQEDVEAYGKFCKAVAMRGVVEPRITPTGSDDTVAVSDLTFEECDMIAGAILRFSGFTMEAAKAIVPLSKTVRSSSSSTPSPPATDASQAGSSEQKTPSNDSPLTSPAPGQASTGSERKPSE